MPESTDAPSVLIVDDDELILQFNAVVLSRAGYAVAKAGGGREALRLVRERPGGFQLLLVDLSMPEMSGEETLRAIRALEPGLPALVCSGYESRLLLPGLREGGRTECLVKPYPAGDLLDSVRALLKR